MGFSIRTVPAGGEHGMDRGARFPSISSSRSSRLNSPEATSASSLLTLSGGHPARAAGPREPSAFRVF